MNTLLIADSGSTKTDWILQSASGDILEIRTSGINPVRDSQNVIFNIVQNQLLPSLNVNVDEIHFYGAGCISPFKESVTSVLHSLFPTASINVESDLLGAARALCGKEPGIACILGTGSNSCYYDGNSIVQNVSPLGYILGDEGSGAVLGRMFLGMLLKDERMEKVKQLFLEHYRLTIPEILSKVYREPQPNVFLASLMPFVHEHRNEPLVQQLLQSQFALFLQRNVKSYHQNELPVNFVGSIAYHFFSELSISVRTEGLILGEILEKPSKKLLFYHNSVNN